MALRGRVWKVVGFVVTSVIAQSISISAHAVTRTIVVNSDGTFSTAAGGSPWITINSGDVINFVGLERNDSIVRIGSVPTNAQGSDVCYDYNSLASNHDQYMFKRAYDGAPGALNEFTGPTRQALSGLWALAPEGGKVSYVETVNAACSTLNSTGTGYLDGVLYNYEYTFTEETFRSGMLSLPGEEVDVSSPTGDVHRLCEGSTVRCLFGATPGPTTCTSMNNQSQNFDAHDPRAIPPGAYFGGLMDSTYENPDVTGVVIRVSWNDIQRDDGTGKIVFNFTHIDREFQRALTSGKFVTLDVRAGRYGTPDWLFTDYLIPGSGHAATWCTASPCVLTGPTGPKPAGAGQVTPYEFKDYYDDNATCGTVFRIGHPGDSHYRDAYVQMMTQLASHVAEDSRRFAALAHIKVSGLNLQTSEAELPHNCDDQYLASGFPVTSAQRNADYVPVDLNGDGDYTDPGEIAPDNIVDVWQRNNNGVMTTEDCWCNPKIWHQSGYTPNMVYDYYARAEYEIVKATFGKKSFGYQIIQDGFPRANAGSGGGFYGDHMYSEVLVPSTSPSYPDLDVNTCVAPSLSSMVYPCSTPTGLEEHPLAGTVGFCSYDTFGATPDHCSVQLVPNLAAPAPFGNFRRYQAENTVPLSQGGRYPAGTEQAEEVLLEARRGRFGDYTNPTYINDPLGRTFVPQHSGLKPLPAEMQELSFELIHPQDLCKQQSTRMAAPNPLPPQFAPGAVGSVVATFPMTSSDPAVGVVDQESEITHEYNGCPNRWIVQEGALLFPGGTPLATGFQNDNGVHSLDHLESSLMNLTYNTNGVFVEVYEDVFWRAKMQKGTGPNAAKLSSAGVRNPAGGLCNYTDPSSGPDSRFCFSKNLSQWSEELHLRRWKLASMTNVSTFPALTDPFPTQYSFTFTNPNPGTPMDFFFIDPTRCSPGQVNAANPAQAHNALVKIHLN